MTFIIFFLILLLGIIGCVGIVDDPWYRRRLARNKYPFEKLCDFADDDVRREVDDIIKEFREKQR